MEPKKVKVTVVMVQVLELAEFNIVNGSGQIVACLGKDYFVLNSSGELESYRIHIGTDRVSLKNYMEQNRLFMFHRMDPGIPQAE